MSLKEVLTGDSGYSNINILLPKRGGRSSLEAGRSITTKDAEREHKNSSSKQRSENRRPVSAKKHRALLSGADQEAEIGG
jgi:hypothetical protein